MHWKLILGIRDTGQFSGMINDSPSRLRADPAQERYKGEY